MVFAVSSQWLAQGNSTQITIREATSGRLQCTLRGNGSFRRLTLGTTLLVGHDEDLQKATVWDLTRGVAVKHYDSVLSAIASTEDDRYYILKTKETDKKMIICEYNASTHAKVRKVKAGKLEQERASLYVTKDSFIVVQDQAQGSLSWRVLDRSTGCKRTKATTNGLSNIKVTSKFAFGVVASSKSLLCMELNEGKVRPTNTPRIEDDYQIVESNGNKLYLLIDDEALYTLLDGATVTAKSYCALPEKSSYVLHSDRLFRMDGNFGVKQVYADLHDLPNQLKETDTTTTSEEETNSAKRKMTVLGPGQAGSLSKADIEPKRAKQAVVTDQDDHDEVPDSTIAERLLQLEQALETQKNETMVDRTSDITTESLQQLVHQGLQSGDRTQLELALQARDAGTIASTVAELDSSQIGKLLVLLTDRIAARPNRAEALTHWISPMLARVTDENLLKPLQNLIQERISVFPRLLQLQGRLDYFERKSGKTLQA